MSAAPDPSARQVLEPCPFCGSAHVDVVMFETHHNEMWHRAECQNCMAKSSGSKYPALAIAAWNRRDGTAELVEALRLAVQRLNESGTGEMGLIDTIHETDSILRSALAKHGGGT